MVCCLSLSHQESDVAEWLKTTAHKFLLSPMVCISVRPDNVQQHSWDDRSLCLHRTPDQFHVSLLPLAWPVSLLQLWHFLMMTFNHAQLDFVIIRLVCSIQVWDYFCEMHHLGKIFFSLSQGGELVKVPGRTSGWVEIVKEIQEIVARGFQLPKDTLVHHLCSLFFIYLFETCT